MKAATSLLPDFHTPLVAPCGLLIRTALPVDAEPWAGCTTGCSEQSRCQPIETRHNGEDSDLRKSWRAHC